MIQPIITRDEVERMAKLARINLKERERDCFVQNLSDILNHFKELSQLDVSEAAKVDFLKISGNQLRKDRVIDFPENQKEEIRKLFPRREDNFLKVKAVL